MRLRHAIVLMLSFFIAACGGTRSPARPSSSTPTVTEIRVGVAGGGQPVIEPGTTKQLFAQAVMSDGTTQDITNAAFWQTSNAQIATVSPNGLLTTYVEGEVTVSASLTATGSLVLQVREDCSYTLSPDNASFDAFGRVVRVTVTSTLASCSWTVRTDVSWIRIVGSAEGRGSGAFEYDLKGNNTPDARSAEIVVSGDRGTALHRVSQTRPSCSYMVDPEEVFVNPGGGSGSFRVNTTPNDCRWTVQSSGSVAAENASWYQTTTGDAVVRYTAYSSPASKQATLSICGLSGQTPCGVFTVRWR